MAGSEGPHCAEDGMTKRKLRLEELAVESVEMTSSGASRGTVHGAQQTFIGCPFTFDCMHPTGSCTQTQTQGGEFTCAAGCMVPRTDAVACCTQGECTIYICGAN
jgi:hypothetical protein